MDRGWQDRGVAAVEGARLAEAVAERERRQRASRQVGGGGDQGLWWIGSHLDVEASLAVEKSWAKNAVTFRG